MLYLHWLLGVKRLESLLWMGVGSQSAGRNGENALKAPKNPWSLTRGRELNPPLIGPAKFATCHVMYDSAFVAENTHHFEELFAIWVFPCGITTVHHWAAYDSNLAKQQFRQFLGSVLCFKINIIRYEEMHNLNVWLRRLPARLHH
jgi:hypothetical protein